MGREEAAGRTRTGPDGKGGGEDGDLRGEKDENEKRMRKKVRDLYDMIRLGFAGEGWRDRVGDKDRVWGWGC